MAVDILILHYLCISDCTVHSYLASDEKSDQRKGAGWVTDKESLTESRGNLVTEIIDFTTCDWVRGGALTLQVFCLVIEDLKHGGTGGLDCVASWSWTVVRPSAKGGGGQERST